MKHKRNPGWLTLLVLLSVLYTQQNRALAVELENYQILQSMVDSLVADHGLDRSRLELWIGDARLKESVIKVMTRPAEKAEPWYQYRKRWQKEVFIGNGVRFFRQYKDVLKRAEQEFGVDPLVITAIIGVETRYGANKGSRYRVLDSLTTLSVDYPRRSPFFTKELKHYFLLASENNIDPLTTTGSYAGAIGIPQFMPSSYRNFSVDFNDDGVSDLVNSFEDAIGSVANYLSKNRWRRGEPVAELLGTGKDDLLDDLHTEKLRVNLDIEELRVRGLEIEPEQESWKVGVIRLEHEAGYEYRVAYRNFFVIATYNPRHKYAMAVHDLSVAIAKRL